MHMAEFPNQMSVLIFTTRKKDGRCPVLGCRNPHNPHDGRGVCSKHKMQEWRKRYPIKAAFTRLRQHAATRGKAFQLTLVEFTAFCNETGYHFKSGTHGTDYHIDRIDHTQGYRIGNIRLLTCSENSRKGCSERYGYARKDQHQEGTPF